MRVKWLKEGESNSKFFHCSLQEKKQQLHITQIKKSHGDWVDNLGDIENEGVVFFQNLLTNDQQGTENEFTTH